MANHKEETTQTPEIVSKSQRRRDALEVKSLARRLIDLPAPRLARVPLDDDLREAIEEARQFRSNAARKRQMLYVAKLIRRIDAGDVLAALTGFDEEARHSNARHHRAEAWRDHLLVSGDTAIGFLLEKRRDADAQALRQLIRNAQRESKLEKPPAAARRLFRLLRELDENTPLPPLPEAGA